MNFKNELTKNKMFVKGLVILEDLTSRGFDALFVGGCVRDLVLGFEPHDVDVATNAPVELIESLFGCHDIGKSKDFGIVVVSMGGVSFEVAQFRTDGEYSDGRRPDGVVIANSFEEDVKRRDFTINALGMDKNGEVVDFVGGLEDLKNKVLRTVGDPVDRFTEDHLRMLRAVRFTSRLGFTMDPKTFGAIRTLRQNVDTVAKERVKDELFKMADSTGTKFADAVILLDRTRLLEVILPELKQLQEVQEEPTYHPEAYLFGDGTSFDHTIEALRKNEVVDPLTNVAILFHDLGKGTTHELDKGKYDDFRHRFHNHGHVGAEITGMVADRLKFSGLEKDVVVFCTKNHMALFHCKKMKKSTAAKYATHDFFSFLKQVMFCDDSCRVGLFDEKAFNDKMELVRKIGQDFKEFSKNKEVKVVSGQVVMELTGLKAGPEVGRVIKEVTEKFMDSEEFVCLRRLVLDSVK